MRSQLLACGFAAAVSVLSTAAAAEAPTVVASIKPVHSLVAGVMEGVGAPHLIVQGGASPHATSLKPSDAAALEAAAVVVWVGEDLEAFLAPSLASLAGKARVVELAEAPGLTRLAYREGGPWEEDEHEEHEEHEEHAHEEHAEEEEEDHHEGIDMHLWLDPENAKAMVGAIAAALIEADPANRGVYETNSRALAQRLDALSVEIARDLAPVKDVPFVVFHDAFQYFDRRFDLATVGSVTVSPEQQPGAQRLKQIQHKIAELGARCVFAEPQFEPRLVEVVVEGTEARTGTLDPLGADIADGPELYFELLRGNAASLKACLGEAS